MANPKANVSFVLLFTFLFSPHVLTHKLPEDKKDNNDKAYYHYSGFQSVDPPPPDAAIHPLDIKDNSETHYHSNDFQLNDPREIYPIKIKDDNNDKAYYHYSGFQPVDPPDAAIHPMEIMDNGKKHYYHHNDFQVAEVSEIRPSDMKNNEPKKHKDGTMRHRKMMRPSEIDDLRSFHAFPVHF